MAERARRGRDERRPGYFHVASRIEGHGDRGGTLDARAGHFAIALGSMHITAGEEGSVDGDREEQRAASDQAAHVQVAPYRARRDCRLLPILAWGHAHHTAERLHGHADRVRQRRRGHGPRAAQVPLYRDC